MTDFSAPARRLAALGEHLSARGFAIDMSDDGLKVSTPEVPGCCDDCRHPAVVVKCAVREEDANRLWYFTGWGEPLSPADRVVEAAVSLHGYLPASGG